MVPMIAINGYGRMGKLVAEEIGERVVVIDPNIAGRPDGNVYVRNVQLLTKTPEVIIDFSCSAALEGVLAYAVAHRVPLVVATTGHTPEQKARIAEAAEYIPVFFSANTAYGMVVLLSACVRVAKALPKARVSVHEIHRAGKADAPSGTAVMLADALCRALGRAGWSMDEMGDDYVRVTYERTGDVVGVHEVAFDTGCERIVLKHEAKDRRVFAKGALLAARFVLRQSNGLYGVEALGEAYAIRQD